MSNPTHDALPLPVGGNPTYGDTRSCERTDSGPRIRDLTAYRLARLETEVLAPARGTAPTDLRLRQLISAYVALAISDPGLAPLLSSRLSDPATAEALPATPNCVNSFFNALRDDLVEVIGTQERIPSVDPEIAVQSLLGIIHWGINCHRSEGHLSRDEATTQITTLALYGLVPNRTESAHLR